MGCFRHMMSGKEIFTYFEEVDCGNLRFGDNWKGRITGKGTIGTNPVIEDVAFVERLKFNLLSVSQLYDKWWKWALKGRNVW